LRDFAKLWLIKLIIIIVIVVVTFISGLLNNINNKENNSNQKKDTATKRYSLKHAHIAQAEKNY